MNQLCRVCGEPAAGFHFGAFTCEGCKSFFGRTYNNLGSITECKNNGECIINKKNRTACKACRLRKCLLVGMSKSGSRYGRRSNWFKIHCLLQEQQQASGVGAHLKDKTALALWGESYKGIPPHSKPSPNEDNSNTTSKEGDTSPTHLIPPSHYPSAEAAAALWAARNSLLPMQLPPHHLTVPFLAPPFTNFHPQHPSRNFLLPFMQSLPSPHNHHAFAMSSSPSPNTSPSPRSSPTRNHRIHTPVSDHSEKLLQETHEEKRDVRQHQHHLEENSLAMLRALGPVQEYPIDLSLKECSTRRTDFSDDDSRQDGDDSDEKSDCSDDRKDENFNKKKKPLDLTKSTAMPHIET